MENVTENKIPALEVQETQSIPALAPVETEDAADFVQEYSEDEAVYKTGLAQAILGENAPVITDQYAEQGVVDVINKGIREEEEDADVTVLEEAIASGKISKKEQAAEFLAKSKETQKEQELEEMYIKNVASTSEHSPFKFDEKITITDPDNPAIKFDYKLSEEEKQELKKLQEENLAKQMIVMDLAGQAHDNTSWTERGLYTAVGMTPLVGTAVQAHKADTEGRADWTDLSSTVYQKVLEPLMMAKNDPTVSPAEYKATVLKTLSKIPNEVVRAELLDRLVTGSVTLDAAGDLFDIVTLGVSGLIVKKAVKGGARTATRAAIKEALIRSGGDKAKALKLLSRGTSKQIVEGRMLKGATKEGLREAGRQTAKQLPFADLLYSTGGKMYTMLRGTGNTKMSDALLKATLESNPDLLADVGVLKAVSPSRSETPNRSWVLSQVVQNKNAVEAADIANTALAQEVAVSSVKKPKARALLRSGNPLDIDIRKNPDDTMSFVYTFGSTDSQYFKSYDDAEAFIARKQIASSHPEIIQDANGYAVRLTANSGLKLDDMLEQSWKEGSKVDSWVANRVEGSVTGSVTAPDSVRRASEWSAKIDNEVLNETKGAVTSIKALPKKDKQTFLELLDIQKENKTWASPEALRKQGVSEKVIKANENYRAINDTNYFLKNSKEREKLVSEGYKDVRFGTDNISVGFQKEIPLDTKLADKGTYYFKINNSDELVNDLTVEDLRKLQNRGYRATKSIESIEGISGDRIIYLYDPSQVTFNPLPQQVLNYVAGGRKYYDSSNTFLKQMRIGLNKDGKDFVKGIHTITAGTNRVRAKLVAETLENVRKQVIKMNAGELSMDAFEQFLTSNKVSKVLDFATSGERTLAKFKELKIDLNPISTIEAVADGEMLPTYKKFMAGTLEELDEEEIHKMFSLGSSSMYTRERQVAKTHRWDVDLGIVDEKLVPLRMDPLKEIAKGINEITAIVSKDDYLRVFEANFARNFKELIPQEFKGNARKALMLGSLRNPEPSQRALYNQARNAMAKYQVVRNAPSAIDLVVSEAVDKVFETAGLGSLSGKGLVTKTAKALRTATADNIFFGNPFQLLKQGAAVSHTIVLHPTQGTQALSLMPLYALHRRGHDNLVAKAVNKIFGASWDDKAAKTFFNNVDELVLKSSSSRGGILDTVDTVTNRTRRLGYSPYRWGENFNRIHSALTALIQKGGDSLKGNKFAMKSFKDESLAELGDLLIEQSRNFLFMEGAGKAPIQRSQILSLFMQFKTSEMRALEVMLDRGLSRAERIRYILGETFLIGAGGLGIGNFFSEADVQTEQDPAKKFAKVAVNDGVLQAFMNEMLQGQWTPDIQSVLSLSSLEFANGVMDLLGSGFTNFPALTVADKAIGTGRVFFDGLVSCVKDEATFGDVVTALESLAVSGQTPSSGLTNLARLYTIWTTGVAIRSRNEVSARDLGLAEKLFATLGFSNINDRKVWELNKEIQEARADTRKMAGLLQSIWLDYVRDIDNPRKAAAFESTFKSVTADLTPEERGKVMKSLHSHTGQANMPTKGIVNKEIYSNFKGLFYSRNIGETNE